MYGYLHTCARARKHTHTLTHTNTHTHTYTHTNTHTHTHTQVADIQVVAADPLSRVALRDTRSGRRIAGNNCPQARNLASYLEANPWMEVWQGVQYMFKCTCMDMYACTHVHVYMYMHTHIHIDTHTYTNIHIRWKLATYLEANPWMGMHIHVYMHTHAFVHRFMRTDMHTFINTGCVCVCVHTHTRTHTQHTHNTHTHTHTHTLSLSLTHRCGRGVLRMRYLHPLAQTCLESQPENTTKCTNYHNYLQVRTTM